VNENPYQTQCNMATTRMVSQGMHLLAVAGMAHLSLYWRNRKLGQHFHNPHK
jgi:hypothetical protein